MPVTDLIADTLTVFRNGIMAHKQSVLVKRSRVNEDIFAILKREGYISNYTSIADGRQGQLKVYLKYVKENASAVTGIKRISKPGLRAYVKGDDIKGVYGGLGR